jgi:hypothetical protein
MGSGLVHRDNSTRAQTIIEYEHHEIHGGSHYSFSYAVADIGAATTPTDIMSLSFTTPATPEIHIIFGATSVAGARWRVIEGKTGGGGTGTEDLAVLNNHRGSTKTTGIISHHGTPKAGYVTYDNDLFTGGTSLIDLIIGATGQGNAVVGGTARSNEFILAASTLYQTSIYLNAASAGSLSLSFYEHTSKA